jgi:hypothetical protein
MVAQVPIQGMAHEDLMAKPGKQGQCPATENLQVIRVRSNCQDPHTIHLAILTL